MTVFVPVTVIKVNGLHLYSAILPYKVLHNLLLIHTDCDATELLCTLRLSDLRTDTLTCGQKGPGIKTMISG